MNGALLNAKVQLGYAIAASKIGTSYAWYRSNSLINPVVPGNMYGNLNAAFSVDAAFKATPKYDTMLYRAFVDITQVVPGDILVGQFTFVMLEVGPIIPPLGLICTDRITIQRNQNNMAVGLQAYGAPTAPLTLIAQGLPANVNLKKETGSLIAGLPSDVSRKTYWTASFAAPEGSVKDGDIITDGEGWRYQVTAANWQSIYYQCLCERLES